MLLREKPKSLWLGTFIDNIQNLRSVHQVYCVFLNFVATSSIVARSVSSSVSHRDPLMPRLLLMLCLIHRSHSMYFTRA